MACPRTDPLKMSQMQGVPQTTWEVTVALEKRRQVLPCQALLSKRYFHTVPGAHTTPGSMSLSPPGLKTKACWLMHPRRRHQEEPINPAAFPSEGHPWKQARKSSSRPAAQPGPSRTHSHCCLLPWGRVLQQDTPKLALEGNLVLQVPCEGETESA